MEKMGSLNLGALNDNNTSTAEVSRIRISLYSHKYLLEDYQLDDNIRGIAEPSQVYCVREKAHKLNKKIVTDKEVIGANLELQHSGI